ncbi:MAG: acyltransferase family protein, partial [Polymorphobacter sp.]
DSGAGQIDAPRRPPPCMSAAPPPRLRTIEAGRGVAALLFVLYHASAGIFPAAKYWNTHVFGRVFDFGDSGVAFFFVLSGFIIATVHAGDIGVPVRLSHYARRRFVRIYPIYWVVLAGVTALLTLPLGLGVPPLRAVLVSSVLLVGPDAKATVLAVAWTLYHEVSFYLVFGLWIIDRRLGAAVSLAWLALVLANFAGMALPAALPAYLASPINLLFAFGAGTWWLSNRALPRIDVTRWAVPTAVAAAATFVAVGMDAVFTQQLSWALRQLAYGAAAATGLAAVVALERSRPVAVPRLMLRLGAASYAIFLTNFTLLSMLAKIAVHAGIRDSWPPELAFILLVGSAVALGLVFHTLIEVPLLRLAARAVGLPSRQPYFSNPAK